MPRTAMATGMNPVFLRRRSHSRSCAPSWVGSRGMIRRRYYAELARSSSLKKPHIGLLDLSLLQHCPDALALRALGSDGDELGEALAHALDVAALHGEHAAEEPGVGEARILGDEAVELG